MLGAVIYHAKGLAEEPDLVLKALEAARLATGGQPLAGYRCIEAGRERHTRWRALTLANLNQLRADLASCALSAVHFDSERSASPEASCSLDFGLRPPSGPREIPYPYNIKVIAPQGRNRKCSRLRCGLPRTLGTRGIALRADLFRAQLR